MQGRRRWLTGSEALLTQSPGQRHQPRAPESCGHRQQDLEEELAECGVPRGHGVKDAREGAMSP